MDPHWVKKSWRRRGCFFNRQREDMSAMPCPRMHELGIAEAGLRAALEEMERQGANRILSLTLRIGELAAVDPESLRFAFAAITPGTPAEGATLLIEAVPGLAWCAPCSDNFPTEGIGFFTCPRCGRFSGTLKQGREIELARLELDS